MDFPLTELLDQGACYARLVEAHVGDVDPVRAIEDALRMYPADEVIVISAPDDETNWLESDLGERVRERVPVPVTRTPISTVRCC